MRYSVSLNELILLNWFWMNVDNQYRKGFIKCCRYVDKKFIWYHAGKTNWSLKKTWWPNYCYKKCGLFKEHNFLLNQMISHYYSPLWLKLKQLFVLKSNYISLTMWFYRKIGGLILSQICELFEKVMFSFQSNDRTLLVLFLIEIKAIVHYRLINKYWTLKSIEIQQNRLYII